MSEITRVSSQGTYTNSGKPSTPFYATGKTKLYVSTAATYPGFVYTPIPAQIRGATIVSAELVGIADTVWPSSRTVTVQRHANPTPTTYSKMTFGNKPGVLAGSTAVAVTQAGTTRTWVWDVTADITAVAAGGEFYGWRIITNDATPRPFRGAESAAGAFELRITYEVATDTPSGLSPSGGAVSVAKPVFTWPAPDNLTAFKIQIDDPDGDFSTPIHDTGWVTSTVGSWDSSGSAWAGLANAAGVDWRVFNRTPAGDSDPSDPVWFERRVKSALTITNPLATSGDPTPPGQWTFAGTQTAFQYTRLRPDGTTWDDSGKTGGTDTARTLALGPTVDGGTATDRIRVWDNVVRVATPGDPIYTEDTQAWALDLDGAIAAATTLSATQPDLTPRVTLTWTRAAGTPDEWSVIRDGEVIARFAGTEHHAGGVWTYVDWTAPPSTEVTYTVRPIVNGVSGASGPADTITTTVEGMFLMDPVNGWFFSTDGSGVNMPLTETSTIYRPPNGNAIKRTTSLGGREGVQEGLLWSYGGRSVEDQLADLEAMRASVNSEYRMVWGRHNIAVVVRNLDHDISYEWSMTDDKPEKATFEAYQTGVVVVAEP